MAMETLCLFSTIVVQSERSHPFFYGFLEFRIFFPLICTTCFRFLQSPTPQCSHLDRLRKERTTQDLARFNFFCLHQVTSATDSPKGFTTNSPGQHAKIDTNVFLSWPK